MGAYDFIAAYAYGAAGVPQAISWFKALIAAAALEASSFTWFFEEYARMSSGPKQRPALAKARGTISVLLCCIALAAIVLPSEFSWVPAGTSRPSVLLPSTTADFIGVSPRPIVYAALAAGIAFFAYCSLALADIAACGRRREAWGFGVVLATAFIALANDVAIGLGLYHFISATAYSWSIDILIVTFLVSSEIIESGEAKEALARSLTELHEADLALKKSQALWAALLESVPVGIRMCDRDGRVIMQNAADVASVGARAGRRFDEGEDEPGLSGLYDGLNKRALAGEVVHEQLSFEADGIRRYISNVISPALVDGKVIGSVGIGIDVTGQRSVESQVQRLSRAIEQSPAIVMIADRTGRIEYVNPSFERSTGYSAAEAIGQNPRLLKSGHTSEAEYKRLWETIASGGEWRGQFLNKRKDGGQYWEEASISPIVDSEGAITHYVAVKQDITASKDQEEALRRSLAEKEVLLREVHHRVKNNLQVVSSLLSINASGILDPEARAAFSESQRQVRAISLAHEALYLSENVAAIDMAAYLRGIAQEINRSFWREGVEIEVYAESLALSIDRAVPCGLLVNELATNAVKHAFPDGRRGKVRIELRRAGEGSALLVVEDDGVGFGSSGSRREEGGPEPMGLRLASALAGQIGGKLSVGEEGRARITLAFEI
jgi:PAS domain S-box